MFARHPRAKNLLMALSVTGVLALGIAAPAGAVNSVTQNVTAGTVTATITDLPMPLAPFSHVAQSKSSTMALNVNDLTDSNAGWSVSVLSSDFTWVSDGTSTGGVPIPATGFEITTANTPTLVAGQVVGVGPIVAIGGGIGPLNTAVKVITSAPAFGNGSYNQALDVSLLIPAGSAPGTYTGTITTSATSAP